VLYFHGTPGSRLLVPPALRYWSESAQFLFVAFDRPGYGLSDYDGQFSFTSVCKDVAHLVTALKLERIGS
jgi:pimeloyl-ACP methyl ester carboxylesterase